MTIATLPGFNQRITARKRPPADHEIVIDSFAGVGGWGVGEEAATGWAVDVAINHDKYAIANHKINHPATRHYLSDVFEIDPRKVEPGRKIAHGHFSPDCKHHSKARGSAPVSDRVRGLAWIVLAWMHLRQPRVITMENVEEFRDWGPTIRKPWFVPFTWEEEDENDRRRACGEELLKRTLGGHKRVADPARKGETFAAFIGAMSTGLPHGWKNPAIPEIRKAIGHWVRISTLVEGLGYKVEHDILRACDYGAPTIRKRFYLIARCDGQSIIWPEKTHGDTKNIERDVSGDSKNASAHISNKSTPLQGVQVKAGRHCNNRDINKRRQRSGRRDPRTDKKHVRKHGRDQRLLEPYRTAAECIDFSLPCPSIFMTAEEAREYKKQTGIQVRRPLADKTLQRIARGVIRYVLENPSPFIVSVQNASSSGIHDGNKPFPTITAYPKGGGHAVVAPYLVPRYGERTGQKPRGRSVNEPMPTIVPTGNGAVLCAAFLNKHYTGVVGDAVTNPVPTVTTTGQLGLTAASLIHLRGTCKDGQRIDEPAPTLTSGGNHVGLVAAFLQTYYGNDKDLGQPLNDCIRTIPTRERFGLVTVQIAGEPYVIVDIGMRMLQPKELLHAQFGEFADGWVLSGTKAQKVAGIGNSVCPHVSRAIVKANVKIRRVEQEAVA